jgi:hypothetical protein
MSGVHWTWKTEDALADAGKVESADALRGTARNRDCVS